MSVADGQRIMHGFEDILTQTVDTILVSHQDATKPPLSAALAAPSFRFSPLSATHRAAALVRRHERLQQVHAVASELRQRVKERSQQPLNIAMKATQIASSPNPHD